MLTQRFNYVDTRLSEFAGRVEYAFMANMTDDINGLAADIAQLNESIVVALKHWSREVRPTTSSIGETRPLQI
ncbi:MAG: hypothetical protein ACJ0RF_02480 [Luminiphilus sp.]